MSTLGIDFGTSYTFIVKSNGTPKPALIGGDLYAKSMGGGTDKLKHSKGIRTAIGMDNNGNWVVGNEIYEAIADKSLQRCNVCWDIKTKLREVNKNFDHKHGRSFGFTEDFRPGVEVPEEEMFGHTFKIGGEEIFKDALEMARAFFEKIFEDNTVDLSDVDCMVTGMPSDEMDWECSDTQNYKSMLKAEILGYLNNDILHLNLDESHLIIREEPVLAGVAYFEEFPKTIKNGDIVLIVDIGGGTTDFALFEVKGGSPKKISSKGNTSPAGNNFNEKLAGCLIRNGAKITDDSFNEALQDAKERLFLSVFSGRMKTLAKVNGYPETNVAEMYAEYDVHGRRTTAKVNGVVYKLVYSNKHCKGVNQDGYGESWNEDEVIEIENDFTEVYKQIAEKVAVFIKDNEQYADKINKVLFVGGTCGIPMLRDYICAAALKLQKSGEDWYSQKGVNVDVMYLETESYSALTCSNAIAKGAASLGVQTNVKKPIARPAGVIDTTHILQSTLTVPQLWLEICGDVDENGNQVQELLISQSFKETGRDTETGSNMTWPLSAVVNKNYVDSRGFLRFRIKRRLRDGTYKYYPSRKYLKADGTVSTAKNWFSFNMKELDAWEESTLTFLADITVAGDIAVFVFRNNGSADGTNERYQVSYMYSYLNGKQEIDPDLKNIYGTLSNCKMYKLVKTDKRKIPEGGNANADGDFLQGKRYSAQEYSDEKSGGFGWTKKI